MQINILIVGSCWGNREANQCCSFGLQANCSPL